MLVSPTINNVHGRLLSITGTDPPANTDISETVPDRRRWRILGVRFQLQTDGNPADRYVHLLLDDGANELVRYRCTNPQTASLTWIYTFANFSLPEVLADTTLHAPFPQLVIPAGYRIRTSTTGLQIADDFIAPQLYVEEWIDP